MLRIFAILAIGFGFGEIIESANAAAVSEMAGGIKVPVDPGLPSAPPYTWPPNPGGSCNPPPTPMVPIPAGDPCDDLHRDNACKNPIDPAKWPFLLMSVLQAEWHGAAKCDATGGWDKSTNPPTPPKVDPEWEKECMHIAKAVICRAYTNRDMVDLDSDIKGFKCSKFDYGPPQYDKITTTTQPPQTYCHLKESPRCKVRISECVAKLWASLPARDANGKIPKDAMKEFCDNEFHWGHQIIDPRTGQPIQDVDKWLKKNTPADRKHDCRGYGGIVRCFWPISPNNEDYFWTRNPCLIMSGVATNIRTNIEVDQTGGPGNPNVPNTEMNTKEIDKKGAIVNEY